MYSLLIPKHGEHDLEAQFSLSELKINNVIIIFLAKVVH